VTYEFLSGVHGNRKYQKVIKSKPAPEYGFVVSISYTNQVASYR
jgi:hypothetical protein